MSLPSNLPHPRALAHLGDAVYELWIREAAITVHQQTKALHQFTTARVQASTQARLLEQLLPTLPDDLKALIKRAENLPVPVGRRSNQAVYRKSTAFEALIGYWYLVEPESIPQRKQVLFQLLTQIVNVEAQH